MNICKPCGANSVSPVHVSTHVCYNIRTIHVYTTTSSQAHLGKIRQPYTLALSWNHIHGVVQQPPARERRGREEWVSWKPHVFFKAGLTDYQRSYSKAYSGTLFIFISDVCPPSLCAWHEESKAHKPRVAGGLFRPLNKYAPATENGRDTVPVGWLCLWLSCAWL